MIIEEGTKLEFKQAVIAELGSFCCHRCFDRLSWDELRMEANTPYLLCPRLCPRCLEEVFDALLHPRGNWF